MQASAACDLWCRYLMVVFTSACPIHACSWTSDARPIHPAYPGCDAVSSWGHEEGLGS
jgi:hypothetical protein